MRVCRAAPVHVPEEYAFAHRSTQAETAKVGHIRCPVGSVTLLATTNYLLGIVPLFVGLRGSNV